MIKIGLGRDPKAVTQERNDGRTFTTVDGVEIDLSKITEWSDEMNGSDNVCYLTVRNNYRFTSKGTDTRSVLEKMLGEGSGSNNADFTIPFTLDEIKDRLPELIKVEKNLEDYFRMELQQLAPGDNVKDIARRSEAIRRFRQSKNSAIDLLTWETVIAPVKAVERGIGKLNICVVASTIDPSLKKNDDSGAWATTDRITSDGKSTEVERGLFNYAGVKTIPIMDDEGVTKAKNLQSEIMKMFQGTVQASSRMEAIDRFIQAAAKVKVTGKVNYMMFDDKDERAIAEYVETLRKKYEEVVHEEVKV